MARVLRSFVYIFDRLDHILESRTTKRLAASFLAVGFLIVLGLIELERLRHIPVSLAAILPANHFKVINMAFTLLLALETLDMVFALPASLSRSVGKQIEVLSLILLRNTFKGLSHYDVPAQISHDLPGVFEIMANSGAALLLFVGVALFYRLRSKPCSMCEDDKEEFIGLKKCVALGLLLVFAVIVAYYMFEPEVVWDTNEVFQAFFTCLIFSDILLVLISLRYLPTYHALFRNSGFAVATLLIRLALVAPPFYAAGISLGAAGLALAIAFAYSRYAGDYRALAP